MVRVRGISLCKGGGAVSTCVAQFLIVSMVIGFYVFSFSVVCLVFKYLRKDIYGQYRDLRERLEDREIIEVGDLTKPQLSEANCMGEKTAER